jgi:hypothetical protein
MALVFDQQPNTYTPLYNQSPWVVRETDTSGSLNDWRMLCRVISLTNGTVEVARFNIRFRDNTQRRIVFDPSEVLKGFVSYDHGPMTSAGPWLLAPNSIHWYVVNFQSQKYITTTLPNGAVVSVWKTQNEFTPPRKCVWNAALATVAFANYNSNSFVSLQNGLSKPLTAFTPTLYKIGTDESYWAHFLSGQAQAPISATITKYPLPNLQGTPLAADPVQSNPFGLSFTGLPSIAGDEYSRPRVRIGIGPRDLTAIASPISFAGVQSYKVVFKSTTTGANTDVTWSFNVSDCHKYAPTRLHWLNRSGGFDAWTFDMKSYDEDSVDRRQFKQQKNVLTGGAYGYDIMSRGTTDYHIKVETTKTIATDNLTDAELEHLRGLIISPVVFIESGSSYVAVNVNTKSWRQKRGVQDGVFNLEMEIQGSLDNFMQGQ